MTLVPRSQKEHVTTCWERGQKVRAGTSQHHRWAVPKVPSQQSEWQPRQTPPHTLRKGCSERKLPAIASFCPGQNQSIKVVDGSSWSWAVNRQTWKVPEALDRGAESPARSTRGHRSLYFPVAGSHRNNHTPASSAGLESRHGHRRNWSKALTSTTQKERRPLPVVATGTGGWSHMCLSTCGS